MVEFNETRKNEIKNGETKKKLMEKKSFFFYFCVCTVTVVLIE